MIRFEILDNGHYPEYHSKIMLYRVGTASSGESAWARRMKLVGYGSREYPSLP
jgi:hypothetical protein